MLKLQYLVIIPLALTVSACGSKVAGSTQGVAANGEASVSGSTSHKNEYSPEYVANFMNSCVANGGAAKSCGCVIEKIESKIAYKDMVNAEMQAKMGGQLDEKIASAMSEAKIACQ